MCPMDAQEVSNEKLQNENSPNLSNVRPEFRSEMSRCLSTSPKATPDKATLPVFVFVLALTVRTFFFFRFSHAFLPFFFSLCFAACAGLIRMFRIFLESSRKALCRNMLIFRSLGKECDTSTIGRCIVSISGSRKMWSQQGSFGFGYPITRVRVARVSLHWLTVHTYLDV